MINLHVIIASTRPGRIGPHVGDWCIDRARRDGRFAVNKVDLAEVALPFLDEPNHPSEGRYVHDHTKAWSSLIDAADAFVLVMPEYNYGFNAELKNALDYLYHEWAHKPVGIVSYGQTSAGTRAAQMIKQVLTTLRMVPLTEGVAIHRPAEHLLAGTFSPPQHIDDAVDTMLDALARYADALSALRRTPAA